jgi:transposase InsO family protein
MASPSAKSSGATPPCVPTGNTPPPEKKRTDKPGSSGNPDGKKPSRRGFLSRSPPRRPRSRHHADDKPRERVIERVVRDSGSAGTWPQLTKTNYVEWSLRMKLKLQARDLWDVVEFGDGDFRDDRTALDAICSAVPAEMIPALAVKETTTEAWEAIRTLRLGDERRRAVTTQSLRAEYETLKLRDGEPIEDFTLRFTGVVQRLGDLGDPEPDTKAVKKFLRIVRPRYKQLVISMEAFVDLSNLSIEEITGTLKSSDDVEEEASPPSSKSTSNQLLLTHEEWMARMKLGDKGASGSSGGSAGGASKPPAAQRGRARGGSSTARHGAGPGDGAGQAKKDKCKYCGKKGHWAKECRSRLRDEAHLARVAQEEADDNEPMLLMARSTLIPSLPSLPPAVASPPTSPAYSPLRVVEAKVFAQLDGGDQRDDSIWYLDSGATNHMSGCRSAFLNIDTAIRGSARFGDGSEVEITGSGTVLFEAKTGEHIPLTRVYFIPKPTSNIVSLGQLEEGGCEVHIKHGVLRVRDEHGRLIIRVKRTTSRLYLLQIKLGRPLCLAARTTDSAWLWHERYGHLHFYALNKLQQKGMVDGLPPIEHVHQLCGDCVTTKLKRAPFPSQAKRRAEGLLDLVHGDLCGPITPETPGGNKFFMLLVDDCSRYMWVALMAAKSDALEVVKKFQARVEVETGRRLRVLRTDNGGEFTSVEFDTYCAEHGVMRQHTAPYTPQQNGVVERRNQTVVTMARGLLKSRRMPVMFWGEVVATAVYLLNRAPTKALDGRTPYEAWHGHRPNVAHLRTFGCVAYLKTTRPNLRKLDDRGTPAVFIGYEPGAKAWRFYDPALRRAVVSRDVVFNEPASWSWRDEAEVTSSPEFTLEYDVMEHTTYADAPESPEHLAPHSPAQAAPGTPSPATPAPASPPLPQAEYLSPPSNADEYLDADNDDYEPRYRHIDSVIRPATPPGHADRREAAELHLQIGEEPASYVEAAEHEPWRRAMAEELQSIDSNKTWRLVPSRWGTDPSDSSGSSS